MPSGWDESAEAWIKEMGASGDFGRVFVLDPVMKGLVADRGHASALEIGCGEGRFCRMMRDWGIRPVGIDPTEALIRQARDRDPEGDYRLGRAEQLAFEPDSFDLVVSYLSLIDIPDIKTAITEMSRVLKPGGTLLIANLTGFTTAAGDIGWIRDKDGVRLYFPVDNYLEERVFWTSWRGIRIQNWHRPLSAYMSLLLGHGLELKFFAEPIPTGGDPAKAARYRRVPFYVVMEWAKPAH